MTSRIKNALGKPLTSRYGQRGIATMLVILMIGAGVVAVSVGSVNSLRGTQETQQVANAQVNAQSGLWAGVEAVRQVLLSLNDEQLQGLNLQTAWTLTGLGDVTLTATVINKELPVAPLTNYLITMQVSAKSSVGGASSAVEAVYDVQPQRTGGSINLGTNFNLYNDTSMTGGMDFLTPPPAKPDAGSGYNFKVDGNFTLNSVGISGDGINNVEVTGDLTINSDAFAKLVHARNITASEGSGAEVLWAFGTPPHGNVTLSGGVEVDVIKANGAVSAVNYVRSIESGTDVTTSNTLYSQSIKAVNSVKIPFTLYGESIHSNGTVSLGVGVQPLPSNLEEKLKKSAKRRFALPKNIKTTTTVTAMGQITCTSVQSATTLIKSASAAVDAVLGCGTLQNPYKPYDGDVEPMVFEPVPPVIIGQPDKVDAYELKSMANYAFSYEAGNKIRVDVLGVKGIPNGKYYLGTATTSDNTTIPSSSGTQTTGSALLPGVGNYLCTDVAEGSNSRVGMCKGTRVAPFCHSSDTQANNCVSHSITNGILTLTMVDSSSDGAMAIPSGVIWVDGNLILKAGPFFNSFIITGNFISDAAVTVVAVNYGLSWREGKFGSDGKTVTYEGDRLNKTCHNESFLYNQVSVPSHVKDYVPTRYCGADGNQSLTDSIGNMAVMTGSYKRDENGISTGEYQGGLISLKAKNSIYGTVMAGDVVETKGNTSIFGYIGAMGLGGNKTLKNTFDAKLLIDLRDLPSTYDFGVVPETDPNSNIPASAKVLWTRYL
jgi:hypothetical protein